MIRLASLFWLALVLISGFAMFKTKYAVQDLEDELGRVRKQTVAERQEIRVLNAEWSYLTQPDRLAKLNRAFLSLAPIPVKQLQQKVDEIPLRPPAPPPIPVLAAAAAPAIAPGAPEPNAAAPAGSSEPNSLDELVAAALETTAAPDTVAPTPVSVRRAPAATIATLKPETAVRLAKASAARTPRTLDQLFDEIGGDR